MEEKKIFLQPDDEITDVIDKIRDIDKSIIVLIIPESAMILQSVVNLKLLKKEADEMDKRLAIVTDSKKGRQLASQVGISVYKKAKADEIEKEENSKRIVDDIKSRFPLSDSKGGQNDKKDESAEEETEPQKPSKRWSLAKKIVSVLLILLFLGGGSVWAYTSLPKADIKLKVEEEEVEETVLVTASTLPNHQPGSFKAELVKQVASEQGKYDATGHKKVGGRASGTITIYNYWSSDPQPLVATTRFVHSSTNKLFRTTQDVTVPGTKIVEGESVPGTVTVNVRAEEIGDSYNVGPGRFNIPGLPTAKQEKIYGRTDSGLAGGYEKEILVVSQTDYSEAKEKLSVKIDEVIAKNIANQLENQAYDQLLDKQVDRILEESVNPAVGQEAGSFKLTIKKQVQTLVYSQEDFLTAIKEKFDSNLTEDKELLKDNLTEQISVEKIEFDVEEEQAKIKVKVEGRVIAKIDEEIVKDNLIGKEEIEAERYLVGFSQIKDAQIDLWPFWVKSIPDSREKIKINFVHE
jgi:hypothetical protein